MDNRQMAHAIAEAVASRGGRAYYVGGFVRDALLGRENKDVDMEVHGIAPAELEEILDSLGQRMTIGESFGIYGLKGVELDIAMPRKEEARGLGHRDFQVYVDPFIGTEAAARRRDFTFNALMQDVLTGEVIDHFGGREDLKNGILRHVDDRSFPEDPLRVLRLAQFAARFDCKVAPETLELCRKMDLTHLAGERIYGELEKALVKARRPSVFFKVLRKCDQLDVWFPELKALIGIPQPQKYHGEGDVWNHTMMVLDEAAKLRHRVKEPQWFMLSALVHDFGKATATEYESGKFHAYGHEIQGLPLAEAFLTRITTHARLIAFVKNQTLLHMKPNTLAAANSSVKATNKLFDQSLEPEALLCLALADDRGRIRSDDQGDNEEFLRNRLDIFRQTMATPYVMGRDLMEAGLKPGPEFSKLLDYAHKLRLSGVDKDTALKQTLTQAGRKK